MNSSISSDDVLLGSRNAPALAAGAANTDTVTLTIPATATVGAYYVVANVDGSDLVNETTETNNTKSALIQIGGDLVVSALNGPSAGAPGSAIVVTDTTNNQGGAPIRASTTRFYLSTNSVLDTADALLTGSRDVSVLDPGASSSGTTTLTLPNALSTGTYYIIANADADGAAPETPKPTTRHPGKF
jgi:subtilase family serine protease